MSKSRGAGFYNTWAESESRFDSKLSTLSGENDTESSNSWVRFGKVGLESDGFGTQDLEANTQFWHSAFSHAVSAVRPFDVREGMEGEHSPETDLIRLDLIRNKQML